MHLDNLYEMSLKDLKNHASNASNKLKDTYQLAKSYSTHEVVDTGKMIYTIAKIAKSHLKSDAPKPSKEEIGEAMHQLKDLGKLSVLIPIFAAPGGGLAIAAAIAYAKKKGINILPTESYNKKTKKDLPTL